MILPASYSNGFAPRDGQPLYPELWRGCVGAWNPGLGPSGLVLRDWSGRSNHGTLTNMDAAGDWVVSGGRYALDFDASNDVVTTTNTTFALSIGQTISATVVVNSTSAQYIRGAVAKGATQDATGFSLGEFNNKFSVWIGGTQFQPSTNYTIGRRYHIAATYAATAVNLFVDGGLESSGTATYSTTTAPVLIGDWARDGESNSRFFGGQVLGTMLHDRVLSENEIRTLSRRPGIAYELAPRRRSSMQVAASFNRRRRLLIGAGS